MVIMPHLLYIIINLITIAGCSPIHTLMCLVHTVTNEVSSPISRPTEGPCEVQMACVTETGETYGMTHLQRES